MSLYHFKVLLASIAVAAAGGIGGGLVFAWIGDRSLYYGIGTGLFVVAVICFGMGVLGATEPPGGWAARRGTGGRKSLLARLAAEHRDIERISSLELLVWGVVVGGGLMAAALVAYSWAAK